MPAPSPRSEIHRKPQRAHYDRATIEHIVDSALVCHIAFQEGGSVHCLPMSCWRSGEHLYIHAAMNSRLGLALLSGECAVCITHVDGLVFARSAFRHSMNFRSLTLYGRFTAVDEPAEKKSALHAFLEHISPGRSQLVRPPSVAELSGTRLLRLPLDEAAAKIRQGGPEDLPEDRDIPVWAGHVPLTLSAGAWLAEAACSDFPLPELANFLGDRTGG